MQTNPGSVLRECGVLLAKGSAVSLSLSLSGWPLVAGLAVVGATIIAVEHIRTHRGNG